MKKYKKLGFVNSKKILARALKGGYAVPAFNFNNLEQLQAVMTACVEAQSPVFLMVSESAWEYMDQDIMASLSAGSVTMMKRLARDKNLKEIPVVLHLDHGKSFEICAAAVDAGFSSVMIDGSSLPYAENIALTKKVADYAHKRGVTVEGELGALAGIEDEVQAAESHYTKPDEAADFVAKTGVDSLAISIGTSHGAYKFKDGQDPKIRLDILEAVSKKLPDFPIVLHGASSVPPEFVAMVNQYGGDMGGARGIGEEDLRAAAKQAVCKINVGSDGLLVITAKVREFLAENPKEFDPRKYLGPAREALKKVYLHKIKNIFGSSNQV